jgi:membrane protease YdiL (CAAX protease family)
MESWRPWTVPTALVVSISLGTLGSLIVDASASVFLSFRLVSFEQLPGGLQIADTVIQELAFAGTAVLFAQLGGNTFRAWHFGLRPTRLWSAAGAVLATQIGLLIFNVIWVVLLGTGADTRQALVGQSGASQSTVLLVVSAVVACVLGPACEELIFRGYIFPTLSNWHGWFPAAVITGLVFGGLHFLSTPPIDLVPLAALGFGLCLLYRYTDSLYPCIAAHAVNNSLAFGLSNGWGWLTLLLMVLALGTIALLAFMRWRVGVISDPPTAAPGI